MQKSAIAIRTHKAFYVCLACFSLMFLLSANNNSHAETCSPPVKIADQTYTYTPTSIQDAYDYASTTLGLTQFTLLLSGELFYENLILNKGAVMLDGGYDCSFTNKVSTRTGIWGTITVTSTGSLNFASSTEDVEVVSTDQCEFDIDLDGFTRDACLENSDDCNDNNFSINPGALEVCGDGIDQNCDGTDETCPTICEILFCPSSEDCTAAGGYWWSDNTCQGVPESETVISAAGRRWMDRNLGATQVATNPADSLAYGFYYQWGRRTDGHQIPTSGTTWTTSSTDTPGHSDFILTETHPYDWRVPKNDNLWQGESGINNPCPAGFRIPTKAEWDSEMASWSSTDAAGAFASPLKLALGGFHCHFCGAFWDSGELGFYWSSTTTNIYYAHYLFVGPNPPITNYNDRAYGYNVRCIQD